MRIQGRKFGIITINERGKPMNNEQNKPTELTEKELEGIAGGGKVKAVARIDAQGYYVLPLGERIVVKSAK